VLCGDAAVCEFCGKCKAFAVLFVWDWMGTCGKDNKFALECLIVDETGNTCDVAGNAGNVENRDAFERRFLESLLVAHDDAVKKRKHVAAVAAAAAALSNLSKRPQKAQISIFNLQTGSFAPKTHDIHERYLITPSASPQNYSPLAPMPECARRTISFDELFRPMISNSSST
jgi:hypothetical protein